jgi:hypothetical protein
VATGGSGNYSSNTVTPPQFTGTACANYGMHVWGNHSIGYVDDAACEFNACQAEGAVTGQVLERSIGNAAWNGGRIFAANSSYGLQLGDAANQLGAFRLNGAQIIGFAGGAAAQAYINIVSESTSRYDALLNLSSTAKAVFGSFAVTSCHKLVFEGGGSTVPSIAAAAGAGTGPPTPTVSNATDRRGEAKFGTGTGPTTGSQVTITFAQPKPGTPAIAVWAENVATSTLAPYVTGFSSTGFSIGFGVAPAASQGATVYQVGYADVTG